MSVLLKKGLYLCLISIDVYVSVVTTFRERTMISVLAYDHQEEKDGVSIISLKVSADLFAV